MWGYCERIAEVVSTGNEVVVRLIDYNDWHNSAVASLKRVAPNDYQEFSRRFSVGDTVIGTARRVRRDRYEIELPFETHIAQAYVHKSEISSFFLDRLSFENALVVGQSYHFGIKRLDGKNEIIEVSRRQYLLNNIQNLRYGQYRARVLGQHTGKPFVYCDELEATLISQKLPKALLNPQKEIDVLVARIDQDTRKVEVDLV